MLVGLLALLCLVDMWTVNKRYLYDEQFVAKGTEMQPFLEPSETDKQILQDKSLDYRVLNLSVNTFNENNTNFTGTKVLEDIMQRSFFAVIRK